jgi:hypothetical protein
MKKYQDQIRGYRVKLDKDSPEFRRILFQLQLSTQGPYIIDIEDVYTVSNETMPFELAN